MALMLEALGVREANAPLAGRRMLSASFGSVGIVRQARPRSAVTVSPTAPGLAPLTGFSRSGTRRRSIRRSGRIPNRRSGLATCLGLVACGRLLSAEGDALRLLVSPRPCAPERTGASSWSAYRGGSGNRARAAQPSTGSPASASPFCTVPVDNPARAVEK